MTLIQNKLRWSLLSIRTTVFGVMLLWTGDKFFNTDHGIAVFRDFYHISIPSVLIIQIIALVELAILIGFLAGIKKRFTYGAVLLFHSVSTFSSYSEYLSLQLFFFTAWPMLAGCLTLYLLREEDVLFTYRKLS